ncbi:MAG: hypothetical protein A2161_11335, partial [Candidatus Schekmanbacteria bacterium RBG_13_48_7]
LQAIRVVLSLGMEVAGEIRFDRKHYVYPDLSKNYQTSQYYSTLGKNGLMELDIQSETRKIRIREAHLEEDAARLHHSDKGSMVDFNRCGQPLLEMVTEPDFRNGEEVEIFIREYQLMLRTIKVSDADMELGQFRCDANVSVSKDDSSFGTRVEIKNINSPRFIRLAIDYEIQRQINILKSGGSLERETRRWNENAGITEPMRSKELALDYRYLSEPDLSVVRIGKDELLEIRQSIPELPRERVERFIDEYKLKKEIAKDLIQSSETADYFEECVKLFEDTDLLAHWIFSQLRVLNIEKKLSFLDSPITPKRFCRLLELLKKEHVSAGNAKKTLAIMYESMEEPDEIIRMRNMEQISDDLQIKIWIDAVIKEHPEAVEKFKDGKTKTLEFLIGQVLKKSNGKVNPGKAKELFLNSLTTEKT